MFTIVESVHLEREKTGSKITCNLPRLMDFDTEREEIYEWVWSHFPGWTIKNLIFTSQNPT